VHAKVRIQQHLKVERAETRVQVHSIGTPVAKHGIKRLFSQNCLSSVANPVNTIFHDDLSNLKQCFLFCWFAQQTMYEMISGQ